jgi:hypothetical protein
MHYGLMKMLSKGSEAVGKAGRNGHRRMKAHLTHFMG